MLVLAVAPQPGAAQEATFREIVQLQPQPRSALADVHVAFFDVATGKVRTTTTPLTDIWMRLTSDSGNIKEILAQPDVGRIDKDVAAFTVELLTVVDGRLHSDTTGTCSAFSKGIAWCKYGCDGQGFELKRMTTSGATEMRILVAAKAPPRKNDASPLGRGPLTLSLCGAEGGVELQVVPAKGKAVAEIRLGNN